MNRIEFKKRMDILVSMAQKLFPESLVSDDEHFTLTIMGTRTEDDDSGVADRFMCLGNCLGHEDTLLGYLGHNLLEMHLKNCENCKHSEYTEEEFHQKFVAMITNVLSAVPGVTIEEAEINDAHNQLH